RRPDRYRGRRDAAQAQRSRLLCHQPPGPGTRAAGLAAAAAVRTGLLVMSTGRFFATLFLALPFAAPAQSVTVVDRIVAVVNKEVVTLSELNDAVGRAERQLRRQNTPAPEQASPERLAAARAKAENALAQARAGGDFGRLAASYSDAADALQGGSLGWRTQDRLPELFAATLLNMNPGDVSEVLRSPAGFH